MDNEWELSKENIQPRRQGRDVDCLIAALTPFKGDNRKQIDNERASFETKLRTYDGNDPLSVWADYIAWSEQHFPKDQKNTYNVIEKCIEEILIQPTYRKDERALNIWLKYTDMVEDPLQIFQFMCLKDIGVTFSNFYIAWAEAFENQGDMKKADEVLNLGINRSAEPLTRLKSYFKSFEMRLVQKIMTDEQSMAEARTEARHALTTLRKDKTGAVTYNRSKGKAKSKELGIKGSSSNKGQEAFTVYQDDENVDPSTRIPLSGSWSKPPTQTVIKKENVDVPGQWKRHKMPVSTKPSTSMPFSIHIDENVATPERTPTQCALFVERKPLSARKVDKVGKCDKLITNLNKPNENPKCMIMCDMEKLYFGTEEFAFEEIRAAQYFKKEEELQQLLMDDDKTKIVEIKMSMSPDITAAFVNHKTVLTEESNENHSPKSPAVKDRLFREDTEPLPLNTQSLTVGGNDEVTPEAKRKNVDQVPQDNPFNVSVSLVQSERDDLKPTSKDSESIASQPKLDNYQKENQNPFLNVSKKALEESWSLSRNVKDLKRLNEDPYSPSNHRCGEKEKRLALFDDDGLTSEFSNYKIHSTSIHTAEACKTVQAMFDSTIDLDRKEDMKMRAFHEKTDIFNEFELEVQTKEDRSAKRDLQFDIYTEETLAGSKQSTASNQRKYQSDVHDNSAAEDDLPISIFGDKGEEKVKNDDNWFIPIQNNNDISRLSISGLSSFCNEDRGEKEATSEVLRSKSPELVKQTISKRVEEVYSSSSSAYHESFPKSEGFATSDVLQRVQQPEPEKDQSNLMDRFCHLGLSSNIENFGSQEKSLLRRAKEWGACQTETVMATEKSDLLETRDRKVTPKSPFESRGPIGVPFAIFEDPEENYEGLLRKGTVPGSDFQSRRSRSPIKPNPDSPLLTVYERTLPIEDSVVAQPNGDQDVSITLSTWTAVADSSKRPISSTPYQPKHIGSSMDIPPDELKNGEQTQDLPIEPGRVRTLSASVCDSLLVDDLRKEIDDAAAKIVDLQPSYLTKCTTFYTHESGLSPIDEGSEGSRTIPRPTCESQPHLSLCDTSTDLRHSGSRNLVANDTLRQPAASGVQCNKGDTSSGTEHAEPRCQTKEELEKSVSLQTEDETNNLNIINPFDPRIVTELVRYIAEIWQDISGFRKFLYDLPKFSCKTTVTLEDFNYTILEDIGVGGFGKVFKVYNNEDDSDNALCALKVIRIPEICVLEHYISSSIHQRIDELELPQSVHNAFARSSRAYLFDDGGCLEMKCYRGTLLDLVNLYKVEGNTISEAFALVLTIELLNILERIHSLGIIHGDIKPDNIFCLDVDRKFEQNLLEGQLLAIGDFGRAMDIKVLSNIKFCGSCNTESFECIQMREKRPWKYQVDYFSLANTLHVLIFGNYLNIYKESNTGRWRKTSSFKRSWDQTAWSNLFEALINHEGFERSDVIDEVLTELYHRLGQCRESCSLKDDLTLFQRVKRVAKKS